MKKKDARFLLETAIITYPEKPIVDAISEVLWTHLQEKSLFAYQIMLQACPNEVFNEESVKKAANYILWRLHLISKKP